MRKFLVVVVPKEFTGQHVQHTVMTDEFITWVEEVEEDRDIEFSFIDGEGVVYFRERTHK